MTQSLIAVPGLPREMRAVAPTAGGGPEVLQVQIRPVPGPGPNDVLIAVAFAGVNRHDCNQRQRGTAPVGATDILGLEVSGRVAAIGSQVKELHLGDEVCALVDGGGYSEFAVADSRLVLPKPDSLSLEQAAALPEGLFTAWLNLVCLCGLSDGDAVLVHGGASGVGLMAMQLARSMGAQVYATAGTDERCDFCMQNGASAAFNYKRGDFVEEVRSATGGKGVDIIVDMAGGLYAERNLRALAQDGRITHLASGIEPTYSVPLRLVMQKRARITGALLRPLPAEKKHEMARQLRERAWPLLGSQITPVLDTTFPLNEVVDAHERMERGENYGKILLRVAS